MARPFLPGEDLAIIGGYMIGLTLDEIGLSIGRSGPAISRRLTNLRTAGFLLPLRKPGPDATKKRIEHGLRDGLPAALVYPLPIGTGNLAAYAEACQAAASVHYSVDPDEAMKGARFDQ